MLCTNLVVKQLYTDVQLLNSLFQKAYGRVLQYMPLLQILNVSERTRMSVVLYSYVPALRSDVRLKWWLDDLFISTLQDIEPY